ncbi:MAG: hypothetical protein HRT72_02405 [Flavobacteriales bacterium]|nr:hypothetical protein [Flavobacteriales bacterium]
MQRRQKSFLITVILMICGLGASNTFATTPPAPGGGGGSSEPPCWPPPCTIPIDGGLSFLIAAGAVYGGKKIMAKNNV